jgi:hypothetical protein
MEAWMGSLRGFVAYPSQVPQLGHAIEAAVQESKHSGGGIDVESWPQLDIAGSFIIDRILEKIDASDFVVVDITRLNFNVMFEAGYAIGRGKRLLPTLNLALQPARREIEQLGVFDTIGYRSYDNAAHLRALLAQVRHIDPLLPPHSGLDRSAPIYILDTRYKTDTSLRITSRVKKSKIRFRSFDPSEQPRLSTVDAYKNVAASIAVIVNLLSSNTTDFLFNNLRAAFLAGLAFGMDKKCLVFQEGEEPVPLDYRDFVRIYRQPSDIDGYINELAPQVVEGLQNALGDRPPRQLGLLERLDLGAPAAENEMRTLEDYYVETDEYNKTLSGAIRLAVGRKGSGKTALFIRVRDRVRRNRENIVLDLKPDGHQLKRFKHMVLSLLAEAVKEHVTKAFWEYLLLLEVAYKLLEKDQQRHIHDSQLYEPYQKLAKEYENQYRRGEGDFSERMLELVERIIREFSDRYGNKVDYLSAGEVTQLVYKHHIPKLQEALVEYLEHKGEVWILFDNIDKGWPTHGVEPADILIVRSLLDATRHVEQQFARRQATVRTVLFVRNDVYELLVDESPDRGKESKVSLDWTDPDLLREFLRRRITSNEGFAESQRFEGAWAQICISHVHGEESAEFLIERSLMRPRNLLNLVNYCKSNAVNLKHPQITVEDVEKACVSYSADIGNEIGLEVRDVCAEAQDLLYYFIGCRQWLNIDELQKRLTEARVPPTSWHRVIELLAWFSFLGVVRDSGSEIEEVFIYHVNYDMKKLRRLARDFSDSGVEFCVHRAFWPFLDITGH